MSISIAPRPANWPIAFFRPPRAPPAGQARPASHRWYIARDVQTVRHRDPVTRASIIELRGAGSQTLVGPSIHPSGEPYDPLDGQPAQVDATRLWECVDQLAQEVIRLRHGDIQPASTPQQPPEPRHVPISDDRNRLLIVQPPTSTLCHPRSAAPAGTTPTSTPPRLWCMDSAYRNPKPSICWPHDSIPAVRRHGRRRNFSTRWPMPPTVPIHGRSDG